MFQLQKFSEGSRVLIHSLGNGKEFSGTVRGKSVADDVFPEHYIVEIDGGGQVMRPNYEFTCIAITEACLKPMV